MTDYADLKARLAAPLYQWPGERTEIGMEAAAAIDALERERDVLTKSGIVEIASRNNRVTEYMFYWEERALVAEAIVARLQAQMEPMRGALSLTVRADNLRELYHALPNDRNRIGDKRSRKSHARDAWLRAFRKAAAASRVALQEDKSHDPAN